jgi:DNA-binding NarL/FixJ family response regulator
LFGGFPHAGCGSLPFQNPHEDGKLSAEMSARRANPLRVLIADDHAIVRSWLRLLLDGGEEIEVVGEAANTADAVTSTREKQPDLVLIDVTMPGGGAIRATAELLAASPTTRVVVLSMHDDPGYVSAALAVGASGYVSKATVDEDLIEAILRVGAGEIYISRSLKPRLTNVPARAP